MLGDRLELGFSICKTVVDQLPRMGKRELICVLLCACGCFFLFGEVSSGFLEWATLFFVALHIIITETLTPKQLTETTSEPPPWTIQ